LSNADRIEVRGIRALGHHGALPGEREESQPIDIDVVVELDLSKARKSDRLEDTLDYAGVHARVVQLVRDRSFALLERLGDEIVSALLEDERVDKAIVALAKPALLHGATPRVVVQGARGER